MANIEMVYREGRCTSTHQPSFDELGYCHECHTQFAYTLDCAGYDDGSHKSCLIPFGDCQNAIYDIKYKGITAKNYQMEPEKTHPFHPRSECMIVRIGRQEYECYKVTLNGKVIFNTLDEEEEGDANET